MSERSVRFSNIAQKNKKRQNSIKSHKINSPVRKNKGEHGISPIVNKLFASNSKAFNNRNELIMSKKYQSNDLVNKNRRHPYNNLEFSPLPYETPPYKSPKFRDEIDPY